jgi:hypothetical protein
MKKMNPLVTALTMLGIFPGEELRHDSKYTAVLAKQLEYVKTKTYDIVYPAFKARMLIPVSNEADSGAETITYRQWDAFGMAQIISNYADDPPLVDALAEEFTQKVQSLGIGYQYSIQDLRRAAMSGQRLDQKRAAQSRKGVEQKIENIAATGDSAGGLNGVANNANVSLISPITGSWSGATGAQMVADMLHFESSIIIANKETFLPTTLVLDIASYRRFNSARISTTGDTHTTALQAFLASSQSVKEVKSWNKLANADAAGTGPRALMYDKSPDVLSLEIPQEYEQFPPQAKNYSFVVPAHARVGGVIWYYPIAGGYMDGL